MEIKKPYLLFLGDAADPLAAKVAQGVKDWRPENAIGQFRLEGCKADLNLPDMTIDEAVSKGVQTLVIGVANRGGVISQAWVSVLKEALEAGLDLAAGLHNKLADVEILRDVAQARGRKLFDVRHPTETFPVASGIKRTGKRLLPVGTDCSCGKMYTALALEKEMRARGMNADFRATGQTGILITGSGVSIDAVPADFISGSVEVISPDNDADHWDLIEGQGSLYHASFAGVTTGLIHGAQADVLVLCHEPTRTHMRGLPSFPVPSIESVMDLALKMARLTNPNACFVAASINTSQLNEGEAKIYLKELEQQLGMPAVDPVREGVGRIVDALQ